MPPTDPAQTSPYTQDAHSPPPTDDCRPTDQARHALTEALRLAEHGYHLTPVTLTRDPETGKKRGRFHLDWRQDPDAVSARRDVLRDWWVTWPDTSFAVVHRQSGTEGVDLDVKDDRDSVAWWTAQGLPRGDLVVRTPTGGEHHYWARHGPGLPTRANAPVIGVDPRGIGGLFYAPGSYILGEQGSYQVVGALPKVVDLTPTPAAVLAPYAAQAAESPPARAGGGDIRRDTPDRLYGSYLRRLDNLNRANARSATHCAYRDGYRLADLGLIDEADMLAQVAARIRQVWGAEPNRDDHAHRATGRRDATWSPWEILDLTGHQAVGR